MVCDVSQMKTLSINVPDAHFESATDSFAACEAVISESLFLLERARDGQKALCGLIEHGIVVVRYSFDDELTETLRLIRR